MQRPFSYVKQTYILLTLADLTLPRYQYGLAVAIFLANMLGDRQPARAKSLPGLPVHVHHPNAAYNAIVSTSGIRDGLGGSHPALCSRAQLQCPYPNT
jgi:hypothetical protein